MDFESYIGKERQLLNRIERERAEMNSHEPGAWRGNYQLASDEIKLLRAGDYVREASGLAADAVAALDERMVQLRQVEREANAKNEAFLKRVAEWEAKFDARYAEAMAAMAREAAALQARDAELTRLIEAAERNLLAIGGKSEAALRERGERSEEDMRRMADRAEADIRELSEATVANLKDLGQAAHEDIDRLVGSLKAAQAEFEASINEKLEQDQQTLEKIRFMISTMSDIIKT